MQPDSITPLILTYNEEPNIGRALERLAWAKDIVVVDSFSSDRTLEIVRSFQNTRVFQRKFDDFAIQCNFGLSETQIRTEWVLALDADYLVPDTFAREMFALTPLADVNGYAAGFRFCVHGRPLRRSLYPARTVLFRRRLGVFRQDGHAHRLQVEGTVLPLKERIDHDDRKPLSHWIMSQDKYARIERAKLTSSVRSQFNLADKIRALRFVAPVVVLFYCLFRKLMVLEGLPGWYYTYQRVTAEILLSLYLMEHRFAALDASKDEPVMLSKRQ